MHFPFQTDHLYFSSWNLDKNILSYFRTAFVVVLVFIVDNVVVVIVVQLQKHESTIYVQV